MSKMKNLRFTQGMAGDKNTYVKGDIGIIEAEEADRLIAANIAVEVEEGELGTAANAEAINIIEDLTVQKAKDQETIAERDAEIDRLTTELEASAKRETDMHKLLTDAGVDAAEIPTAPEALRIRSPLKMLKAMAAGS